MNEKKKKRGFAGKAGESRRAGIDVIFTRIAIDDGKSFSEFFSILTEANARKGYQFLQTTVRDGQERVLFKDADVLGSIKAHLRACERCYYGDKK